MGFLAKNRHEHRRKTDVETWENTLEEISWKLCPVEELEAYRRRRRQLSRSGAKAVQCFPVWRKYRSQALKVAAIQRALPVLRHLPVRVSYVLGEILYK